MKTQTTPNPAELFNLSTPPVGSLRDLNAPYHQLLPQGSRLILEGVSLEQVDDGEGVLVASAAGVPGRAMPGTLELDSETGDVTLCVWFKGAHIATTVVLDLQFKLTRDSEKDLRKAMSAVA